MFKHTRAMRLFNDAMELEKQKKYDQSFPLYLEAAKLGHARAQNKAGYAYMNGQGTAKNYNEAVYWLEKSAAQNDPVAFTNLGYCYEMGYGVVQSLQRAMEYYEKAAALGSAVGMCNLATCYESLKKYDRAFLLFLEAAKLGDARAQSRAGYTYLVGQGTAKNYNEAVYWLEKSAAQNYSFAFTNLGFCYEKGYGVVQDLQKALECYEKAVALGYEKGKQYFENLNNYIKNKNHIPEQNNVGQSGQSTAAVAGSTPKASSAMDELDALIGLDSVKQDIKEMIQLLEYQKRRKEANKKTSPISMHMVFTGNPGTGKTTVARIIARIYRELGLLEKEKIVEVDRGDLVGEYIGHTAIKTKKKIDEAMGGVLFIDEAYTLVRRETANDFGKEAIDTLLKEMEDNRDKLMVIVAGYTEEMHQFISSNPGLESRFKKVLHFDDYNAEQLCDIFCKMAKSDEYYIDTDVRDTLRQYFQKVYSTRGARFGNGRDVRNFYQDVLAKHAARAAKRIDLSNDNITKEDVEAASNRKQTATKNALVELNEMIGLENVKKEVNQLIQLAKYQKLCQENNIQVPPMSMHMVFTGNPGTGKTTVARLIGEIYHEIGLLSKPDCLEVDRSMLVAQYIGQTAIKTKDVIDRAMGGVLFIDEAYMLSSKSDKDFGQEAIDTLLKEMEDHRESLVVIVAGYQNEMQMFIDSNPGLKSRFTKTIHFDDYQADEMEQIFRKLAQRYVMTDGAQTQLHRVCAKMLSRKTAHFGNGREVRNFYETVISKLACRVSGALHFSSYELTLITEEDILAAEADFFRQ